MHAMLRPLLRSLKKNFDVWNYKDSAPTEPTRKASNKEHITGELPAFGQPLSGLSQKCSVTVGFAMLNPRLFKFVPFGDR